MTSNLNPETHSNWLRLSLFILLWIVGSGVIYAILVFPIFPNAITSSRAEFDNLIKTNGTFLLLTQFAMMLGTLSTFWFFKKAAEKQVPILKFSFRLFYEGCAISILIISACSISMAMTHIISFNHSIIPKILISILVFLMVAISEEIVCRGYILNNLLEKMRPAYAVMISSLVFALFHIFNKSFGWVGFINIFLSGVLMAAHYLKNRNLSHPIGMHFAWNFMQGAVLGFAVSGEKEVGLFHVTYHSSNDYLTGGNFGIEGSCILTPFLLLLIYWFYRNSLSSKLRFNHLFNFK